VAKTVPGVSSALAERLTGGRYIDVDINRAAAARYGSMSPMCRRWSRARSAARVIGQTVEGLARYPISVRYPRELRDSLEELRSPAGPDPLTPADHARHRGRCPHQPMARRCCAARMAALTWVYVDGRGRDLASKWSATCSVRREKVRLPPGVSIAYTGQFEFSNAPRSVEARRAGDAAHHLRAAL
jgi:Cu(I)/Ag(I) efflux system membrane protein CusA/SilA